MEVQNQKPPRMGWKLAIFVLIVAIALAIGFAVVQHEKAQQMADLNAQVSQRVNAAPMVDIVEAQPAPSSFPFSLPGETHGWYQATIYARVSGYVGNWTSDIGDRVHKNQVMATIETPDLDAQLQAAKEQLLVAESDVSVAQANADFANTTYQRWKEALPQGYVSTQETEEKKAGYDSGVAELKASQSKVSAAQAEVNRLDALEQFKQVTAPFDGVVTNRSIDIGNLVTAGSTTNTSPLYTVAQIDVIRVFVDVPQDESSQIYVGMPAQISANNFAGRIFPGKVARTADSIDPRSRTLRVEVDRPNPDGQLTPGMYVDVSFDLKENSAVQVPASAMLFRDNGPMVAVVGDDGTVSLRNVTIAQDNGDIVDLASGVRAGEKVALNLNDQIASGDHVTISQEENNPSPSASTAGH